MNKFFKTLLLVIFVAMIFGGGLWFGRYVSLKRLTAEPISTEPLRPGPSTATFDFSKLEPAPTAPIRIVDGEISAIDQKVISVEVDVTKIFPKSPLKIKTINVKVNDETKYVIAKDSKASEIVNGSLSDLRVRNPISITIGEGETNRDIFTKNDYAATRILVFPSSRQF